jgi:colanic acid biosynthesis glycosyl transferase WcaI
VKVLVVAQLFPPDMGGGATRASNVVKGLTSAGCDVTVVAAFPHYPDGDIPKKYRFKPLSMEYSGRVKVVRTFVPPLASKGFSSRLVLFACFMVSSLFAIPLVGNPEIVWAANPNILAAFPAIIFKMVKGCEVAQNVDDLWPDEIYELGLLKSSILRRLAEFITRFAYSASSVITPISPSYVDVMIGKYGVSREKVQVVPAGVDLQLFQNDCANSGNCRFRVLYVGAFSPTYDFDQILRAARLLEVYTDIEFVIQGGGELASQVKNEVAKLKLDNVQVVRKIVSREAVAQMLGEADVLLLPLKGLESTEMGISSKLYEYQAAGKPILCCSSGQQARYVSETNSGIIVKPGDHEALAKALLFLKENPSIADKLGKAGRHHVENNLSLEKIGLKMKAAFNRVHEHVYEARIADHD